MFNDINQITLLGNVVQDPELKFTNTGSAVLNFSIATNRRYQVNEEWQDETTFHNIVLWRSAESIAKRMKKGTRVVVQGRLQSRSWDGNDGQKKYKTEIVADMVSLVARYEQGKDGENTSYEKPEKQTLNNSSNDDIIDPDDLPF